MALSGLDIYKLLPKTNCKKCGSPTCLAFAMKLAMKKAALEECPFVTEEAKRTLSEASRPPIATISFGEGDGRLEAGGELVLFRHEKTFYHPTLIAIPVYDDTPQEEREKRIRLIEETSFERVGQHIPLDMIALINRGASVEAFSNCVQEALSLSRKPFILVSDNSRAIEAALKVCHTRRPLIYAAGKDNLKEMASLAGQYKVPLALKGQGLEEIDKLSKDASSLGLEELVIDPQPRDIKRALNDFTQIRRLSLKKNYRSLGYPIISFLRDTADDFSLVQEACVHIIKYASIIVVDSLKKEVLLPLVTARQNIYTDPQKPVTVEPRLYSFGQVSEGSPLMVTTNFSLTFYTVSPEIEASKVPSYLLVTDSEGMSVLTAWAAEKFTPEVISETLKKFDVDKTVSHRKIIIPGYVSVISGKLEDVSGWNVMVGPKEASGIPKYLKEVWK